MESAMAEGIEGGCRCGTIRYRIKREQLPRVYACHCHTCQTWSGSAFSMQTFLPEAEFEIIKGEPEVFEITNPSGAISRQRGCRTCFTRIYNSNSARPGIVVVRMGTVDRSDELDLVAHIWVKRKLAGVLVPPGVPTWVESAPVADLLAALAPR
jgi:hypothetical protein